MNDNGNILARNILCMSEDFSVYVTYKYYCVRMVNGKKSAPTVPNNIHRLYGLHVSLSLSFKVDGVMQGVFSINIKKVGL
jgi:hypothetical protein